MRPRKYGKTYVMSAGMASDPAMVEFVRERALKDATDSGATARFEFVVKECEIPFDFDCPLSGCGHEDDEEHTDWCDAPIEPHGHAWWTGWTA